jgi:UDP-N-acetylmuramyl pentapeptide phosphotransferase/UDP-N-acetylglucosamine-1-phosphate transferase
MNYIINLGILGGIVMICSFILTRILIYIMPKLGIVDIPSKRRAHKQATPRGGGLSFIFIFSISLPIFEYIMRGSYSVSVDILQIFLPISLISFWDDVSHVAVPVRLFMHILCALLAVMWLVHPSTILHYEIPMSLDLAIGTFALLTFLNVYNFLDGIDGITVSESIHLSCTILLLCIFRYDIIPNVDIIIMIATIILGWSMGFIYFNWQPAQIFLGDVGSISIGFLIGVCLLIIASASAKLFAACVIAALYYIADGGMTILIRLVKGERIWEPHLQHFFQKAVRKGHSHKKIVKRIMKCNILLMLFAVNALYYPVLSIIAAILIVMVTLIRSVI